MQTPIIWLIRLENAYKRIIRLKQQHRLWSKHLVKSAAIIALSIITILSMTGVMFFTNDVYITQDEQTKKFFTMKKDAEEILAELGYTLGEFDRVIHGENEDGENTITIIKGFEVEITADDKTFTAGAIPGEDYKEILHENGIPLGEYDIVITGEKKIEVFRGFDIDVKADGKTVKVGALEIGETTVNEVLQNAGIKLNEGDIVNMPFDETVAEGDEVVVNRVTHRDRTHFEKVPYETAVEFSNLMAIGETKVTEGEDGEYAVRLREKLIDGEVVTSEVLSRTVVKEAKTKVITHGMALKTPYSKKDFPEIRLENGLPIEYIAKHTGKATAYTAPPTSGTASGRKLEIGTVAVNPKIIPYGSLLYIVSSNGESVYGAAIAADTGGFIQRTDKFVVVDLFMGLTSSNYGDALRWGLREVDVYVINSGIY